MRRLDPALADLLATREAERLDAAIEPDIYTNVIPCAECGRRMNEHTAIWWHSPWSHQVRRIATGQCGKVRGVALCPACLTPAAVGGNVYPAQLGPAPKSLRTLYDRSHEIPEPLLDEYARTRGPLVVLLVVLVAALWAVNLGGIG